MEKGRFNKDLSTERPYLKALKGTQKEKITYNSSISPGNLETSHRLLSNRFKKIIYPKPSRFSRDNDCYLKTTVLNFIYVGYTRSKSQITNRSERARLPKRR